MANRDYDASYWKNEYENLRRKKNKEIINQQIKLLNFMDATWKLLKSLKVPNQVIFSYYRSYKK